MTLTADSLRQWEESTFTPLTSRQRQTILERFGTEPEHHEWTQQDIAEQIRNIITQYPAPATQEPAWA